MFAPRSSDHGSHVQPSGGFEGFSNWVFSAHLIQMMSKNLLAQDISSDVALCHQEKEHACPTGWHFQLPTGFCGWLV